jgi:DNA-binding transcriptional MerR regulator
MAKLHGITRQTLIYYDEIGLFKPALVRENGYRCYDKHQIPYLREICFLKSLGIQLKDMRLHFQARTPENEVRLLENQQQHIEEHIKKLRDISRYLTQRVEQYKEAAKAGDLSEPFLCVLEPRLAVFKEYIRPINKANLHITLMSIWQEIFKKKMISLSGIGSIIKKNSAEEGCCLEVAGSCIFLPLWQNAGGSIVNIPAGEHVCMYKYGMPYETEHLERFMSYLEKNSYILCGDIIDVCLLDTTFYKHDRKVDFCVLQAPVKRI